MPYTNAPDAGRCCEPFREQPGCRVRAGCTGGYHTDMRIILMGTPVNNYIPDGWLGIPIREAMNNSYISPMKQGFHKAYIIRQRFSEQREKGHPERDGNEGQAATERDKHAALHNSSSRLRLKISIEIFVTLLNLFRR